MTRPVTEVSHEGPTPAGGVRSTVYYRAADGSPADRDAAVKAEVVEWDADGNALARTYAVLGQAPPPPKAALPALLKQMRSRLPPPAAGG